MLISCGGHGGPASTAPPSNTVHRDDYQILVQEIILQAYFLMQLYPNSLHASTCRFTFTNIEVTQNHVLQAHFMIFQLLH